MFPFLWVINSVILVGVEFSEASNLVPDCFQSGRRQLRDGNIALMSKRGKRW
jgi:hypothetical protein